MSSLIVSHDLHIMMLELAVEKLYVPRTNVFDAAILKKTTVMFRLLDDEWTALYPQRSDYRQYRGSNYESEPFHGGKSIVFSLPEASLQNSMENVNLQMHITKDVSRYFEMHPSQNVGFVIVTLDKLFNGIINELRDRKQLAPFLHFHEREPISRSMKGDFTVLDENSRECGSHIELYIRLSYFGKSIITEILAPTQLTKAFYAQEETNEKYPYQCRELKAEEIEADCWGSVTAIPPMKPQNLQCDRQTQRSDELFGQKPGHMSDKMGDNLNGTIGQRNDKEKMRGTDKKNGILRKENKGIDDADNGTKDDKKKKKDSRSKEKAERTDKEGKSEKIDETEKSKKSETGKSEQTGRKIIDNAENLKKMDKIDEKGKFHGKEKSEKVGKREKGKTDKTDEKEKVKKGEKEKVKKEEKEKVKPKGRNETNAKETVKIGKRIETQRNDGIKYMKKEKEIRDNEGKRREKLKDQKPSSIEPNKLKMIRRRNAGPITVGIFEKNIPPCLQITPPCPCIDCNSALLFPLSCPSEIATSLVSCLEQQTGNNPILSCF